MRIALLQYHCTFTTLGRHETCPYTQ